MSELTAALATIEKFREITNCPAGVGLQDHLRKLVVDNEKAMDSLRQADAAVKLAHEKFSAIAAENVGLVKANKVALNILNDEETMVTSLWASSVQNVSVETPATDAYLAGIKADGVEEFIGRLQQCVDDGDFVGDEVAVIVGAIDCGKEFCEQLHEGAK